MARILRLLVSVGVGLGLGGGLLSCGPSQNAGPTDVEQEKKFIEKGGGMRPSGAAKGKTKEKDKAGKEENKEKTKAKAAEDEKKEK